MLFSHFMSVAALQLCVVSMVVAQDGVDSTATLDQSRTLNRAEVGGIVTGQTITLAGRAFYDSFAAAWNEKDEVGHFTVAISERPSARWGSQVFVDYGNRRLFQMFLPPNRSLIPPIGTEAAAQVYQAILDYQLAQFFGDPDMARDEL
ncbi:CsgE family curli-type amyloid fiber assembly protein [Pseudomonas sp. GG8]